MQVVTGMRAYAGVPTPLLPHRVAVEGLRPSWPESVPADLVRLAEACWVEKPQHRWGDGAVRVWVWVCDQWWRLAGIRYELEAATRIQHPASFISRGNALLLPLLCMQQISTRSSVTELTVSD